MSMKKPWEWNPNLTEDRLVVIGKLLSNIYNDTAMELQPKGDIPYVVGTACFGRAYNALLILKGYDWYRVTRTTLDLVFEIGGTPCRFFSSDTWDKPKPKVFKRNLQDSLFPETEEAPCQWRFLIQKPTSEEFDSFEIYFAGFNFSQEIKSVWSLNNMPQPQNMDNIIDMSEFEGMQENILSREVSISRKNKDEGQKSG